MHQKTVKRGRKTVVFLGIRLESNYLTLLMLDSALALVASSIEASILLQWELVSGLPASAPAAVLCRCLDIPIECDIIILRCQNLLLWCRVLLILSLLSLLSLLLLQQLTAYVC